MPCFGEVFGNAASGQHAFGRAAAAKVETARGEVAALLGCLPSEIVFTSGATEADNLAIKGVADAYAGRGRHLVTCATEHRAVLDSCARLERRGFEVTYLGVDEDGRVDPAALEAAIRDDTVLVSLMLANNEIGVVHPIAEVSQVCRERGVLLHCDAAQGLAYLDCRVDVLGVDLLSISGHKIYGPKGVGALYARRRGPRVRLVPRMDGGGHERGRRSGTLDVPGIVGLGRACALVADGRIAEAEDVRRLRDLLLERLKARLPDLEVHGSLAHRLPNNLNLSIPGVEATDLLERLDTVAASSGAACSSASTDGSYVLKALPGSGDAVDRGSLRLGLGRFTTPSEVERAAVEIADAAVACRLTPKPPIADACGVTTCP